VSARIAWMAAAAEKRPQEEFQSPLERKPPGREENPEAGRRRVTRVEPPQDTEGLESEQGKIAARSGMAQPDVPHLGATQASTDAPGNELAFGEWPEKLTADPESERRRRVYRARTVGMLRRYLRYSIETGRLPSLLGREFFRAKVTSYTVVTFEDRVIFAHDMELCLDRLDEFSRQLIARHVLQEHDRRATAQLLHCNEKTVRRLTPLALDTLAEILLDVGLMDRLDGDLEKSCQGGLESENAVSDCEDGDNKF
jgi:hypothetical protein